ncbi:Cysteine-rich venom protein ophanin [Dissostichus eleginoides]|uniref:Cysteine-rich venom protein ophanin n=1 Tax=Dissostichus eleginoides TaxID=100907 RepID=A0AAD9BTZ2_DISEL|nr:Cysteine-rich venom protein ophanin [Dissostichus eleginoides]
MCSSTCDDDDVWKQIQAMRMRRPPTKLSTLQSNPSDIVNKHNDLRRNVRPTASNMLEMLAAVERTCTCPAPRTPGATLSDWYDEVQNWRYGVGSTNGRVVGHYTQVQLYLSPTSCGVAYCPNSQYKYFYVCQYCPPGNFQYARPYKSGPSCGDCPNACNNKLCTNPCPYADKYSNCPDLKQQETCSNADVASWCPASCKCTSQII